MTYGIHARLAVLSRNQQPIAQQFFETIVDDAHCLICNHCGYNLISILVMIAFAK